MLPLARGPRHDPSNPEAPLSYVTHPLSGHRSLLAQPCGRCYRMAPLPRPKDRMTKPQIDRRVLVIFQALLQEHGKDKVDWCERKASELRVRLMQEAKAEAKKRRMA